MQCFPSDFSSPMAAHTSTFLTTPARTPSEKSSSISRKNLLRDQNNQGAESVELRELRSRFEAYNRLQAAAVAFGEKLPIPEIVALGGQSDGKSSLLEAFLGFRFNVREVEMGTRRPLILQMVHDPTALEPRCRFQEEDSEEYGSSVVLASAIADIIKSRTEALLNKSQTSVSSKPIVMRAEYAHCPNLTIIDTPGFVLKAKKGEPENTPEEILSMVKTLASPPSRILLFLQQSSVEWCSSLWLDAIREIDPTFRRTVIVVSKFDNRLKEFSDRWEVDRYLSATGYLGDNIQTFFVALPKDRSNVSNDEFRRQISQVDSEVLRHLREDVNGGFNEEKFGLRIGFGCLKEHLESELQKRYIKAAPVTLALLQQRCSEVAIDLERMESKILATSDIGHLRRFAMSYTASVCHHVGALIDGAVDPSPEQWGKTTFEELSRSSIGNWPGVSADVKPPNATLRLYGGAAFERVMREFWCAAHSLECPSVSREKVANILLAHAGRGTNKAIAEAAAEIARTAARSWLAPLLDTACDRLAFVLENLFDLALESNHIHDSEYGRKPGNMDGYVGFHAALRHVYIRFIKDLAKQCKQLVRKHLDYVTSPFSLVCYETESGGSLLNSTSHHKFSQNSDGSSLFELSDGGTIISCGEKDQENIPPEKNFEQNTPGKASELTVPETPSPDQPCDVGAKKDLGNGVEMGAKKWASRMTRNNRNYDRTKGQDGAGGSFGNTDGNSRTSSTYSQICLSAAQYFSHIREVLVDQSVASTLNAGFLTPCREKLVLALGLELFAVNDEKFMDMFAAPGAIDDLQNERQSLKKRQKTLQTCLNEFKSVTRSL